METLIFSQAAVFHLQQLANHLHHHTGTAARLQRARILPEHEVPPGELFPGDVDGVPVDITEGRPPALERPEPA